MRVEAYYWLTELFSETQFGFVLVVVGVFLGFVGVPIEGLHVKFSFGAHKSAQTNVGQKAKHAFGKPEGGGFVENA
jgi:site-specific recombinase